MNLLSCAQRCSHPGAQLPALLLRGNTISSCATMEIDPQIIGRVEYVQMTQTAFDDNIYVYIYIYTHIKNKIISLLYVCMYI